MQTIFSSMEQLFNSKRLKASGIDAADLEALAPNYFLLGQSVIVYPNVVFNGRMVDTRRPIWANRESMKKIFDRWIKEDLPQLTTRKKRPLEEKSLVVIGDLV